MNWFFISLISPALWAICNHLDKYLLGHFFKGASAGAPLIFTGFSAITLTTIIAIFHPAVFHITVGLAVLAVIGGASYIFGLIPYMYALQKDEASRVVPLFQLVPVFTYFLALIFLQEVLTFKQITAVLLIIGGAFLLSAELGIGSFKIKRSVLLLVALSSLLLSLNGLVFKAVATESNFWTASYWSYVGVIFAGAVLLCGVRTYRNALLKIIRQRQLTVLGLTAFNESISIIARLTYWFAATLAPVALVQVVSSAQSLFVFIYGLALTIFIPKFGSESVIKAHLVQKLVSIAIILMGSYVLLT
jgi:drug/metabolite transporter (DMT)-like permease